MPCSAVTAAASSLRLASSSSRMRNRISARRERPVARQAGKAARAAARPDPTSAARRPGPPRPPARRVPGCTRARSGPRCPHQARPSIQWLIRFMGAPRSRCVAGRGLPAPSGTSDHRRGRIRPELPGHRRAPAVRLGQVRRLPVPELTPPGTIGGAATGAKGVHPESRHVFVRGPGRRRDGGPMVSRSWVRRAVVRRADPRSLPAIGPRRHRGHTHGVRHVDRGGLRPEPDDPGQHGVGPAGPVRRPLLARARIPGAGPHRTALLDALVPPGRPDARVHRGPAGHLGLLAGRHPARLPGRFLSAHPHDADVQSRPAPPGPAAGVSGRGRYRHDPGGGRGGGRAAGARFHDPAATCRTSRCLRWPRPWTGPVDPGRSSR